MNRQRWIQGMIGVLALVVLYIAIDTLRLFIRTRRNPQPAAQTAAPPPRPKTTRVQVWKSGTGEQRMTFSRSMPRGAGRQIVDGRGRLKPTAVRVAVQNAAGELAYLDGTDPQAAAYLEQRKRNRAHDPEPQNVQDIQTTHGPLKNRTDRRIQLK